MSRLLDLATGAALGALGLALIVTLNERLEEETRRLWRRGLLAASRAARSTLTYDQEDEHGDEQEFSMSKSPGTPGSRAASGARKCQLGVGYNKQLAEERRQIYALLENMPRLPELDYVPTAKYEEAPIEEVLHPLIAEASVILVAGAPGQPSADPSPLSITLDPLSIHRPSLPHTRGPGVAAHTPLRCANRRLLWGRGQGQDGRRDRAAPRGRLPGHFLDGASTLPRHCLGTPR